MSVVGNRQNKKKWMSYFSLMLVNH